MSTLRPHVNLNPHSFPPGVSVSVSLDHEDYTHTSFFDAPVERLDPAWSEDCTCGLAHSGVDLRATLEEETETHYSVDDADTWETHVAWWCKRCGRKVTPGTTTVPLPLSRERWATVEVRYRDSEEQWHIRSRDLPYWPTSGDPMLFGKLLAALYEHGTRGEMRWSG